MGSFARMCMEDCPPVSDLGLLFMGVAIFSAAYLTGYILARCGVK
jgi:hypothetical protein